MVGYLLDAIVTFNRTGICLEPHRPLAAPGLKGDPEQAVGPGRGGGR